MEIVNIDNDSRLGMTFLDIKNKEFATPDEVMIDKKNGKMYYKKPDGSIVASTESLSTTTLNMLDFSTAINKSSSELVYPTAKDANMVMMEHRLPDGESCVNKSPTLEGFKFRVSKDTNGFFITLNTRQSDDIIIEVLTSLYNTKHPTNTSLDNAIINFSVKYVSAEGLEVIKTKQSPVKLNVTKLVLIDLANTITELTNVKYIEVTLIDATSPLITEMITDASYTVLPISATGDGDIALDSFNIGTFMDSIDSLPTDDNTSITNIYTAENVSTGINSAGGDSKEIEERFLATEGLLPKVITDIVDLPTGEGIPSMSLYIEEVVNEAGDI